ncbi:MAG: YARHG domain-containing protein [Ignavibacteria bacterium]|nr:YARHG domain-containing protein [Ignavibacteria bacterium]
MKKFILVPFIALSFIGAICSKSDDSATNDQKKKDQEMQKNSEGSLSNSNNSAGSNSSIYPQASDKLLTSDDVSNLDAWELKIMRNEIYARHGYIFKTEEMKSYFGSQKWYSPRYENVDDRLTDVEKKNIALIKRYESRLGNNDYSR